MFCELVRRLLARRTHFPVEALASRLGWGAGLPDGRLRRREQTLLWLRCCNEDRTRGRPVLLKKLSSRSTIRGEVSLPPGPTT